MRWTMLWIEGVASAFQEDGGRRITKPNTEPMVNRSSPLVVQWLLDASLDRRAPLPESAELLGRARLEPQTCLVVQARSVDQSVHRLWIDEASGLLVRIDLSMPPDPVREAEARATLEAQLAREDLPMEERASLEGLAARPTLTGTSTTEFSELHRSELDGPIDLALFHGK